MESDRATALACVGLAARATAPALLHAIRGNLHDVMMLTALLQPAGGPAAQDGAEAKGAQRLRAINAQLELLARNVALLDAMIEWPSADGEAICATASVLPDVVRLLHDGAARHRIRLEHDLEGLPPHIRAGERALQRALLASGAWRTQYAPERATLRFIGREEAGEAVFDFEIVGDSQLPERAPRAELDLLAALARAAGGRLATTPALRLSFERALGRCAAAA